MLRREEALQLCQVTNDVVLKDGKHSDFKNCAVTSKSNNKMAPNNSFWCGHLTKWCLNKSAKAHLNNEEHQPTKVLLCYPKKNATLNIMERTTQVVSGR